MTARYYAGVGSRETTAEVLLRMKAMAATFAKRGWSLRSGHAEGADTAFFRGADAVGGKMEIFLPWSGFGGAPADDPRAGPSVRGAADET